MKVHRCGIVRIMFMLVCAVWLCGCSGCSEASEQTTPGGDAPQIMNKGARKADSMSSFIDQILSYPETTDKAREVLERARENGGISVSDYENAWADYKQCMLDKGYREILLIKYPNGMYDEAMHTRGTHEQESKYDDDKAICSADLNPINMVYGMQQGNPDLYSNINEAIVDCLKKNHVVPKGYTAEQYAQEQMDGPDSFTYDVKNPKVRGCQVANKSFVYYEDDPVEHLW